MARSEIRATFTIASWASLRSTDAAFANRDPQKQIFVPKEQDRHALDSLAKSCPLMTVRGNRLAGGWTARLDTSCAALLSLVGLASHVFAHVMAPEDTTGRTVSTVLLPVQAGKVWRVQIIWPNGSVHYFGNFARKQDAVDWVTAHAWLTVSVKTSRKMPE
jgi:hypothetical protein